MIEKLRYDGVIKKILKAAILKYILFSYLNHIVKLDHVNIMKD